MPDLDTDLERALTKALEDIAPASDQLDGPLGDRTIGHITVRELVDGICTAIEIVTDPLVERIRTLEQAAKGRGAS